MQGATIDAEYAGGIRIDEYFYEQVIIEHLRDDLGYEYLHGPDVPRTTQDYRDVFLPVFSQTASVASIPVFRPPR